MNEEPPATYNSFKEFKAARPDLFKYCDCSESLIWPLPPAPTKFLQKLCESIDFSKPVLYNNLGDSLYKIKKELPDDSDAIEVQWCLDFLYLTAHNKSLCNPNYKYITLWSFIFGFLGIKDSNYDYILMNYLEHCEYIEHGTAIRCGYLIAQRSPPTKEFSDLVDKWIVECDKRGNNFDMDRPWLL